MNGIKDPLALGRFRAAAVVALLLCGLVFALILRYGDSPRPTVDRLNVLLGPLVILAFAVLAHAFWQLRRTGISRHDEF